MLFVLCIGRSRTSIVLLNIFFSPMYPEIVKEYPEVREFSSKQVIAWANTKIHIILDSLQKYFVA